MQLEPVLVAVQYLLPVIGPLIPVFTSCVDDKKLERLAGITEFNCKMVI